MWFFIVFTVTFGDENLLPLLLLLLQLHSSPLAPHPTFFSFTCSSSSFFFSSCSSSYFFHLLHLLLLLFVLILLLSFHLPSHPTSCFFSTCSSSFLSYSFFCSYSSSSSSSYFFPLLLLLLLLLPPSTPPIHPPSPLPRHCFPCSVCRIPTTITSSAACWRG